MKLVFGPDFPAAPPKGYFITPIFHPNVSKTGEICVNTLKKDWKADCKLSHILMVCAAEIPSLGTAHCPFPCFSRRFWMPDCQDAVPGARGRVRAVGVCAVVCGRGSKGRQWRRKRAPTSHTALKTELHHKTGLPVAFPPPSKNSAASAHRRARMRPNFGNRLHEGFWPICRAPPAPAIWC